MPLAECDGEYEIIQTPTFDSVGLKQKRCATCRELIDGTAEYVYFMTDTNGSKSTDVRDLVHLYNYMADPENNTIASDVGALDGNEGITTSDMAALRYWILGF